MATLYDVKTAGHHQKNLNQQMTQVDSRWFNWETVEGATGGDGKHEQTGSCQLCCSGKLASVMTVSWISAPALLCVSPCEEEEVGGRQAGRHLILHLRCVWRAALQVTKQEEHDWLTPELFSHSPPLPPPIVSVCFLAFAQQLVFFPRPWWEKKKLAAGFLVT